MMKSIYLCANGKSESEFFLSDTRAINSPAKVLVAGYQEKDILDKIKAQPFTKNEAGECVYNLNGVKIHDLGAIRSLFT